MELFASGSDSVSSFAPSPVTMKIKSADKQRSTRQPPPGPDTKKQPDVRQVRRSSQKHLEGLRSPLLPAERTTKRHSLPILIPRRTPSAEKEPKDVRRARKQMSFAAAALNAFPLERRREMLAMAIQLPERREIVETKWVALQPDSRGNRFKWFRLIVSETGDIELEEKTRRMRPEKLHSEHPGPRFSIKQKRVGAAQLNTAIIWQSFNAQGFRGNTPTFDALPPNDDASALSED